MIDLSKLDRNMVIARGEYSIVREKREKSLKEVRDLCEETMSVIAAILRAVQNGEDVARHLALARTNINFITDSSMELDALRTQLNLIRPLAFPE